MTSNAGARDLEKKGIGFGSANSANENASLKEALDRTFSPEFRNRLDAVVPFSHLNSDAIRDIVVKEISYLQVRLSAKKVVLSATDDCIEYISRTGYSREFGARNISRMVDELIATPLVDEVLFGRLSSGGKVTATLDGSGSSVVFLYAE